ncbi:MAG: enterochelin esterase domain-containing protein [Microbacterium sp.]
MVDPAFRSRPEAADRRLLTVPPHTPRPAPVEPARSPAVEAVRADPAAADALWERASREGTPIVEGDGERRSYTWLHRGPARRVALIAGKLTDDQTFERVLFEQIDGTDLWALSLRLGSGWRCTYALAIDDGTPTARPLPDLRERRARSLAMTDPERHERIIAWYDLLELARPDPLARESFRGTSVAAGPDAPRARPSATAAEPGRLEAMEIRSAAGGTRRATWHLPAHPPRGGAPCVVLLDGDRRIADGGERFDAWAQTHLARGTVALLLGHGDIAQRDADLTCSPELVDDLRALVDSAPVPLAADPALRAIQGSSLGGLTALYAQCVAPDLFGVSICQSGSFWWPNARSGYAAEWLTDAIESSDVRLGKVHLSVGTDEWVLVDPVRRMRDAVAPRAAVLDYEEFDGGHEAACWEAALPGIISRLGLGRE